VFDIWSVVSIPPLHLPWLLHLQVQVPGKWRSDDQRSGGGLWLSDIV